MEAAAAPTPQPASSASLILLDPADALTVASTPAKGKHLIASRDLPAGAIVLRASAYAWGITSRAWYTPLVVRLLQKCVFA